MVAEPVLEPNSYSCFYVPCIKPLYLSKQNEEGHIQTSGWAAAADPWWCFEMGYQWDHWALIGYMLWLSCPDTCTENTFSLREGQRRGKIPSLVSGLGIWHFCSCGIGHSQIWSLCHGAAKKKKNLKTLCSFKKIKCDTSLLHWIPYLCLRGQFLKYVDDSTTIFLFWE